MGASPVFPGQCEEHRRAGRCLLASLSSAETVVFDAQNECEACSLVPDQMDQSISFALAGGDETADRECDRLVQELSGLYTHRPFVPPAPGLPDIQRVGPYTFIERIGRGSMGTVYLARHNKLQRECAVKVLDARGDVGSRTIRRFRRETRSLGRVQHPNLVEATDAGEADGVHYIAMHYLNGVDLAKLTWDRTLPVPTACEIVRQAALGVHHAHEHGLIHRDIKPSNLMVCHEGDHVIVKVLDLGLVRTDLSDEYEDEDEDEDLTPSGIILGTFGFMAPEQLDDPRNATARSDVYSLGVVLWKLLTGEANVTTPPSGELLDQFSEDLQDILLSAVALVDSDRPESAAALAALLEPFCGEANLALILKEFRSS